MVREGRVDGCRLRSSESDPPVDVAAAEHIAGDAKLERLAWVPRISGRAQQIEHAGDHGPVATAEAHLDGLPERQSPHLCDLVAEVRRNLGCRARRQFEGELVLVFRHGGEARREGLSQWTAGGQGPCDPSLAAEWSAWLAQALTKPDSAEECAEFYGEHSAGTKSPSPKWAA